MKWTVTGLFLTFSLLSSIAHAAEFGGGAFLEVQDGKTNHDCIDVSKYDVSMMLAALQAKRTENFWKQSKTLGAKFDIIILNKEGRDFTFPRAVQLSAKDTSGDIALLPIHSPIMSKYSLVSGTPYVNVTLKFYLINIESQSSDARAISDFIDFSKSLPLPPNPYTQGVQLFGDFAQKLITDSINAAEEKEPVATFSFDLPSSDDDVRTCPENALKEGVNAVMFDYPGDHAENIIRVTDTTKYCYYFITDRIFYREKENGKCNPNTVAHPLWNPLVAFTVSKWSKNPGTQDPKKILSNFTPSSRTKSSSNSQKNVELLRNVPDTITTGSADLALKKVTDRYGEVGSRGENVKAIYRNLNEPEMENESGQLSLNEDVIKRVEEGDRVARVREAETATNIQLCSVVGIAPTDCQ